MNFLRVSSRAVLGSLVTVACNGSLIHEVGDINSAAGASGSTSLPPVAGGMASSGGASGLTSTLPVAGGAIGVGGNDWNGTAGGPWVVANGLGGATGVGGTNSRGGGSSSGGLFIDPADPSSEGVTLYLAWVDFMSGTGYKTLEVTWHNGTDHSIFLDTSCPADWWRLQGDSWVVGLGANDVCPNSSGIRLAELLPGTTYRRNGAPNLAYYGAGTYRLRGTYWLGCGAGSCTSSHQAASAAVKVVVRTNEPGAAGAAGAPNTGSGLAGTAGVDSTVTPDGLHATCSADGPCAVGQTAIGIFYTNSGAPACSCEIPCDPGSSTCPSATSCQFVSDGLGSLCQ